ncbi:hypothetical protein [Cohnella yongneupensis]|uniref:Muconolactone isomerase domain-containing protein n=1 Tax=Cohnella yongneupensis TaxID=425006 RepID=A0ABW0R7N1_9BACL
MKSIKMSLVSRAGQIVNEWAVPFVRRHDALEHAMDRAEQEGHLGVLWVAVNNGGFREIAFDSHDPEAILSFARLAQPYLTMNGLDIDRFLSQPRAEGVKADASKAARSPSRS